MKASESAARDLIREGKPIHKWPHGAGGGGQSPPAWQPPFCLEQNTAEARSPYGLRGRAKNPANRRGSTRRGSPLHLAPLWTACAKSTSWRATDVPEPAIYDAMPCGR